MGSRNDTTIPAQVDSLVDLSRQVPPASRAASGQLPPVLQTLSAKKPAGRLVQFLTQLDAEGALVVEGDRVRVQRSDLRRKRIAALCDVRSEGTVGEWLTKWRAEGWLLGEEFNLTRFLAAHGEAPSSPPRSDVLSTLLDRLETAHERRLESLAENLTSLIEMVISDAASPRGPRGEIPRFDGVSRGVVSERNSSKELTHSLTDTRKNPAPRPRNRDTLETLLEPLAKLTKARNLVPMTNLAGVEKALVSFSNEEVRELVRRVCELTRKDTRITSPFGLLVHTAAATDPQDCLRRAGSPSTGTKTHASDTETRDFEDPSEDATARLRELRAQLK